MEVEYLASELELAKQKLTEGESQIIKLRIEVQQHISECEAANKELSIARKQAERLRTEYESIEKKLIDARAQTIRLQAEISEKKRQLQAIRASFSFQLGRALIAPIRKPSRITILFLYILLKKNPSGIKKIIRKITIKSKMLTSLKSQAERMAQQSEPATFILAPDRINKKSKQSRRKHFDVILMSDFSLPGGTTSSNTQEINVQKMVGLRTGLFFISYRGYKPESAINPKIKILTGGDQVQLLKSNDKIYCDLLILRHPAILQEKKQDIPDVKANHVVVIMNQTPYKGYGPKGTLIYDLKQCASNMKEYFNTVGKWYPNCPMVREALHKYHSADLPAISLADEDWINIINVNQWRRDSRPPRGLKIKIGRHSRDDYAKWPANRDELLMIYPDSDDYEVHILGGAKAPLKTLGRIPDNWNVLQFGEMNPKDFLSNLDVFVFYPHPECVEAFSRVIIEAMAVGVPVILPHSFRQLFQEAAIFAEPAEAKKEIDRLMQDDDYYNSQVTKAWRYVESNFGYNQHILRLKHHLRLTAKLRISSSLIYQKQKNCKKYSDKNYSKILINSK
jgi:glycosyltransferase involved in cell wall biosynthesis